MEVSVQLHTPAALPAGKDPPGTRWIGDWVSSRAALDALAKRRNPIITPTENRTPVV